MTRTKSNRMKALAAGAAITVVLGGGATAVFLPSFASAAVPSHSMDDLGGHESHGADDAVGHVSHGADDPVGHARHGADDPVGHG